jgi:hypothetical protein
LRRKGKAMSRQRCEAKQELMRGQRKGRDSCKMKEQDRTAVAKATNLWCECLGRVLFGDEALGLANGCIHEAAGSSDVNDVLARRREQ